MMIGSFSGIRYRDFAGALAPVAAVGMVATVAVIAVLYRRKFRPGERVLVNPRPPRYNRLLMWKSLIASVAMIVFFFVGWPVAKVAIVAGGALLVTRRVEAGEIYRGIHRQVVVGVAGLIIVAG